MEIDNYPSNSGFELSRQAPAKKEKPKAHKVTQGSPKFIEENEKPMVRQIIDAFFNTENIPNLKRHIIFEVMIPGAQRMVMESIESFFGVRRGSISSAFGGTSRSGSGFVRSNNYNRPPASRMNDGQRQRKPTYDYNQVFFDGPTAYEDACDVLEHMLEDVSEDSYGLVTVNSYYDYAGVEGDDTACNWGWYDLRSARVERIINEGREGYVIRLPRPVAIK